MPKMRKSIKIAKKRRRLGQDGSPEQPVNEGGEGTMTSTSSVEPAVTAKDHDSEIQKESESSNCETNRPVMDPRYSAQDVLLCDLCDKDVLQSHCEPCKVNLCVNCVGKHLSDPSKRHNVVPYRQRKQKQQQSLTPNYPKCSKHEQKLCELYCERCNIPVCSTCLSSGKHFGHHLLDVLQKHSSIQKALGKDLAELKDRIHPSYQKIASNLRVKKAKLEKHYGELTTLVIKQGDDWHKEIEIIVNKRKSYIEEMRTKHLEALEKHEDEVAKKLSEIKQNIVNLEKILSSNNVSFAFANQSRNAEFRRHPKLNASFPSFSPPKINTEQLNQLFGYPSALSINTEVLGYTLKTSEPLSVPSGKPFLDEPEPIITLYTDFTSLASVICLNEEKIWTSGRSRMMKLYNLQSKLLMPVKTRSGNDVDDIAVTKSGELVYTDPVKRTVYKVNKTQIEEVIRLQGWRPRFLCSTSSNELLITVDNDDKQSKVVRYSGSTMKQTIQFDEKGVPLYSSCGNFKYICENKNLDVCVADNGASAVVVVNHAGKLRFRYTGCPSSSSGSFYPYGITTDSQSQILTSENLKDRIHILNCDGQFLRFIQNCDFLRPLGLCVDSKDNLFVAQSLNGNVKKIKYM